MTTASALSSLESAMLNRPRFAKSDANTCYVCGGGQHAPTELHVFWSVADAARDFAREDARLGGGYDAAAAYVAQHRPY